MNTKKLTFIIVAFLFSIATQAQTNDTTTVKVGKKTIVKIISINTVDSTDIDTCEYVPHFFHHWTGIGFGINTLVSPKGNFNYSNDPNLDLNYGKSWSFHFNFAQVTFPIIKPYFGIVIGMGFTVKNYRFYKSNLTLTKTDTLGYYLDQTRSYEKSKLTLAYLTIPVLLQINTASDYFLAFGVYDDFLLNSHTKQKTGEGDKIKNKGFSYIESLNSGAMIQLGHNNFTVFASYNLVPIFKKNRGPEAYPLDFGFILNF